MNILESRTYADDIKQAFSDVLSVEKLKNSSVLVTGATGLVCSAVIDLLISSDIGIAIYAAGRNVERIRQRFGDEVSCVLYDSLCPLDFDIDVDYVIHGASNASPDLYTSEPVETMTSNIEGLRHLLDYSVHHKVKKILFVSSSEVYGRKETTEPYCEDQYGYVDLLNARSSYSIAKRAAETLCASYAREYGTKFNVVRLGHIYGPTATSKDNRVSSLFARKAAFGEDLVLKSSGNQIRSYCYCVDCASAMLSVLTVGVPGEAYNISNRNSVITIREMAELLATSGNVSIRFELPDQIEIEAFNPMQNSSLNSEKIESLGWVGRFNAQEGLSHTVSALKELPQERLKSK